MPLAATSVEAIAGTTQSVDSMEALNTSQRLEVNLRLVGMSVGP